MYVAIDVGGTKTLVAVFDEQGQIKKEKKSPTNKNYEGFFKELVDEIDQLVENPSKISAIGVGMPGTMDYEKQIILRYGNLDWHDVDIKHRLEKHYSRPVGLENDANAGAIGEANLGAGKVYDEVLYITISTGIGTGVTVKGRIDPALADSEGGSMHFRHQGKLVRWEKFASGQAFVERYGDIGANVNDSEIWKEYAKDLSLGIGSLIAVIQPEVVILGGSMGAHIKKYRDHLFTALHEAHSPIIEYPPIIAAERPEKAVIYGCYWLAKELG